MRAFDQRGHLVKLFVCYLPTIMSISNLVLEFICIVILICIVIFH